MLDSAGLGPDLSLFLGPDDLAAFIGMAAWRDRMGRTEPCLLYVLLHRREDACWTHACRIRPDRRAGHVTLLLERALPGDRREELAAWLRAEAAAMAD